MKYNWYCISALWRIIREWSDCTFADSIFTDHFIWPFFFAFICGISFLLWIWLLGKYAVVLVAISKEKSVSKSGGYRSLTRLGKTFFGAWTNHGTRAGFKK